METKKGISLTSVLLVVLIILVLGMFCYIVFSKKASPPVENQPVQLPTTVPDQNANTNQNSLFYAY